jgi:ureidoacrylate peracid hydrolase
VVPRGMILEKEIFIPLSAVVKRAGTDLFINVPKLIVGKMPWTEPPTGASRSEKLGRSAGQV